MMLPSADALAALVPDGALLAMPPDNSLPSVAIAKALIRRGARNLRLLGVPVSGFATDILIGAGCVAELEAWPSLGEPVSPRFSATLREAASSYATPPARRHSMLQASEKGIPFIPLRIIARTSGQPAGLEGGAQPLRRGWRTIVLLPARRPTSPSSMRDGRQRRQCLARPPARMRDHRPCLKAALVTVGASSGAISSRTKLAPGAINSTYITATAIAERGGIRWRCSTNMASAAYVSDYARAAKTEDGFHAWLDREVFGAAQKVAE